MSFFDIKVCPFCSSNLEFYVPSSLEGYDSSTMKVGVCYKCHGTPLYCLDCGTKAIVQFKGGMGCPNCGNNKMNSCTVPYNQ